MRFFSQGGLSVGRLRFEKVKPEDREQIEEICAGIWNGHDYIPLVFDEWVKEEGFYCGKIGDRIVALDKYTWHKNGVLWLEGLRVHPDFQGMGIGTEMVELMWDLINGLPYFSLRFMTSEANVESIHLAEKKGFGIMAEYYYLILTEEELKEFEIKGDFTGIREENDPEKALEFVRHTGEYWANRRQYLAYWVAYDMDAELMRDEVRKGNCFSIVINGEIDSIAFFYRYDPRNALSIAFLAGSPDGIARLIRYGINLARNENMSFSIKTASGKVRDLAIKEGLVESRIGKARIYEKKR